MGEVSDPETADMASAGRGELLTRTRYIGRHRTNLI